MKPEVLNRKKVKARLREFDISNCNADDSINDLYIAIVGHDADHDILDWAEFTTELAHTLVPLIDPQTELEEHYTLGNNPGEGYYTYTCAHCRKQILSRPNTQKPKAPNFCPHCGYEFTNIPAIFRDPYYKD